MHINLQRHSKHRSNDKEERLIVQLTLALAEKLRVRSESLSDAGKETFLFGATLNGGSHRSFYSRSHSVAEGEKNLKDTVKA